MTKVFKLTTLGVGALVLFLMGAPFVLAAMTPASFTHSDWVNNTTWNLPCPIIDADHFATIYKPTPLGDNLLLAGDCINFNSSQSIANFIDQPTDFGTYHWIIASSNACIFITDGYTLALTTCAVDIMASGSFTYSADAPVPSAGSMITLPSAGSMTSLAAPYAGWFVTSFGSGGLAQLIIGLLVGAMVIYTLVRVTLYAMNAPFFYGGTKKTMYSNYRKLKR